MLEDLILKYLEDSITHEEFEMLIRLLKNPKNKSTFENYIRDYHDIELSLSTVNLQEDFDIIKDRIHKKRELRFPFSLILKYAAVLIFILGISHFYFQHKILNSKNEYAKVPSNRFITLEKQNGEVEEISLGGSRKITNIHGQVVGVIEDEHLILKESSTTVSDAFHTIKVPYGCKFKVTLTDGTRIHLNSGSFLRYPLGFIKDRERKVFLEGEAYFKVARTKKVPFIVESASVFSKVLGTEFNYRAYPDDKITDITLIEGSIGVGVNRNSNQEGNYQILTPSQKASHSKTSDSIEVKEVNIQKYIAWTQGSLVFEDDDMRNILKILQRHYDVKFINKYPELNNYRFSGVFKDVNLEDILKTIQTHTPFTYTVKQRKVIIEPIINP